MGWGMSTAIFVHGTGVREPAFSKLFERVTSELQRRRPELTVKPCYWGGSEGAQLWHGGDSVPAYDTTRAIAIEAGDEELVLWELLYQDALWELRMLAVASPSGGELPPGSAGRDRLDRSVQALDLSSEIWLPRSLAPG